MEAEVVNDDEDGVSGADGGLAQGLGEDALAGTKRSHQYTSGGCSRLSRNSHDQNRSLEHPIFIPGSQPRDQASPTTDDTDWPEMPLPYGVSTNCDAGIPGTTAKP